MIKYASFSLFAPAGDSEHHTPIMADCHIYGIADIVPNKRRGEVTFQELF
jgi:hypothetical protein